MTKQCFYCSYPNKDDATRCINCGMELKKYWDKSGSRPRLVDTRNDLKSVFIWNFEFKLKYL